MPINCRQEKRVKDSNNLKKAFIITIVDKYASLTFKCKECNTEFEDKKHLENHKKVHGRKHKVHEYDPESRKYDHVDPGSSVLRHGI
jgi:hypothetical protein